MNIGGFANLTRVDADSNVSGFDIGPGNVLLDDWNRLHNNSAFDRDGVWAAEGSVDQTLLEKCLSDSYFSKPPPKSTGRDYFNLNWLKQLLPDKISAVDVQANPTDINC